MSDKELLELAAKAAKAAIEEKIETKLREKNCG